MYLQKNYMYIFSSELKRFLKVLTWYHERVKIDQNLKKKPQKLISVSQFCVYFQNMCKYFF